MPSVHERVGKNGARTYRAQVRVRGRPSASATFKRKSDALRWARAAEEKLRTGQYFPDAELRRHTVADLVDRYVDQFLSGRSRGQVGRERQLQWWRKQIGSYALVDVTPSLIAECREKLLKGPTTRGQPRSNATVNRYLAALSHAFSIAVKEWEWLDQSPTSKVSKLKEPRGRVRFLSEAERRRLLDACRKHEDRLIYPIVLVAVSTGMRQGEILNLRWRDLDFNRSLAIVNDSKNQERRSVHLVGDAKGELSSLAAKQHNEDDYVFPNKRGTGPAHTRKAWEEVVQAAELDDFRFHDLRHTFASYLAMSGATLVEIAEALGHKTLEMVRKYAHLAEGHTQEVVARMNKQFLS